MIAVDDRRPSRRLQRATCATAYFASPTWNTYRGRRFICSSPGDAIYALVAWGELDLDDTRELLAVFEAAGASNRTRRQLVILQDVRSVSPRAMMRFAETWNNNHPYFRSIIHEAVVRPEGVVGMLAEGFYALVPRRYEGRVFGNLSGALSYLDADPVELSPWLDALTAEVEACQTGRGRLQPLLAHLADRGAEVSLSDAARALAISTRSLQRLLADAGTTFAHERRRVSVARARELLTGSDLGMKEIAAVLGFRTPNRFSEAFRAETGMSPTAWRDAYLRQRISP